MFRPLFTASVEYLLTLLVWKRGTVYPKIIATVLFFLASYQFGEFIYFATDHEIGIRMALGAEAKEALPWLQEMAQDKDARIAGAAKWAIGQIGGESGQ